VVRRKRGALDGWMDVKFICLFLAIVGLMNRTRKQRQKVAMISFLVGIMIIMAKRGLLKNCVLYKTTTFVCSRGSGRSTGGGGMKLGGQKNGAQTQSKVVHTTLGGGWN
jgi:hypothetical protein